MAFLTALLVSDDVLFKAEVQDNKSVQVDTCSTCRSDSVLLAAGVNSALNMLLAFGFGKPYGPQIWPEATESNSQKAGKPAFVAKSVQMLSLVSQENTSSQTIRRKSTGGCVFA